jgi:hypothetical protein
METRRTQRSFRATGLIANAARQYCARTPLGETSDVITRHLSLILSTAGNNAQRESRADPLVRTGPPGPVLH